MFSGKASNRIMMGWESNMIVEWWYIKKLVMLLSSNLNITLG